MQTSLVVIPGRDVSHMYKADVSKPSTLNIQRTRLYCTTLLYNNIHFDVFGAQRKYCNNYVSRPSQIPTPYKRDCIIFFFLIKLQFKAVSLNQPCKQFIRRSARTNEYCSMQANCDFLLEADRFSNMNTTECPVWATPMTQCITSVRFFPN